MSAITPSRSSIIPGIPRPRPRSMCRRRAWSSPATMCSDRTLTFTDGLTLNVGDHTFEIVHHPGHTAPQTSVYVPEEGVVFTGDNVFHKCRSWLQECDPWEWLG